MSEKLNKSQNREIMSEMRAYRKEMTEREALRNLRLMSAKNMIYVIYLGRMGVPPNQFSDMDQKVNDFTQYKQNKIIFDKIQEEVYVANGNPLFNEPPDPEKLLTIITEFAEYLSNGDKKEKEKVFNEYLKRFELNSVRVQQIQKPQIESHLQETEK